MWTTFVPKLKKMVYKLRTLTEIEEDNDLHGTYNHSYTAPSKQNHLFLEASLSNALHKVDTSTVVKISLSL